MGGTNPLLTIQTHTPTAHPPTHLPSHPTNTHFFPPTPFSLPARAGPPRGCGAVWPCVPLMSHICHTHTIRTSPLTLRTRTTSIDLFSNTKGPSSLEKNNILNVLARTKKYFAGKATSSQPNTYSSTSTTIPNKKNKNNKKHYQQEYQQQIKERKGIANVSKEHLDGRTPVRGESKFTTTKVTH